MRKTENVVVVPAHENWDLNLVCRLVFVTLIIFTCFVVESFAAFGGDISTVRIASLTAQCISLVSLLFLQPTVGSSIPDGVKPEKPLDLVAIRANSRPQKVWFREAFFQFSQFLSILSIFPPKFSTNVRLHSNLLLKMTKSLCFTWIFFLPRKKTTFLSQRNTWLTLLT